MHSQTDFLKVMFDSVFTEKFFHRPETKEEQEIKLDFELPSSDPAKLGDFLQDTQKKKQFLKGIAQVVNDIKKQVTQWANENKKEHWNIEELDNFYERFTRYSGSNLEENEKLIELYTNGIIALKRIAIKIMDDTLPINQRKNVLHNLLNSKELTICGPGASSILAAAYLQFTTDPVDVLMTARFNIASDIANHLQMKFKKTYHHPEELEIHYINYVLYLYQDALGINVAWDAYIKNLHRPMLREIALQFAKYLEKSLTLDSVLEHVAEKFDLKTIVKKIQQAHVVTKSTIATKTAATDEEKQAGNVYSTLTRKLEDHLNQYGSDERFSLGDIMLLDDKNNWALVKTAGESLKLTLLHRLFNCDYLNKHVRTECHLESGDVIYLLPGNNFSLSYVKTSDQKTLTLTTYLNNLSQEHAELALNTILDLIPAQQRKTFLPFLYDLAVENYHFDFVVDLIKKGEIDINYLDYYGQTPFFIAAEAASLSTMQQLNLMPNIDVNKPRDDGTPVLLIMVQENDIRILQFLLKETNVNINQTGPDGSTALMYAVNAGNLDIANLLIQQGAKLGSRNNQGFTALEIARAKKDENMENLLLSQMIPSNKKEEKRPLPLAKNQALFSNKQQHSPAPSASTHKKKPYLGS
ncbi:MAG: ankyrin 2,3/unc44 [uncultured bacterium]|nr:MAG: ankyrin 2,3/unc44 [uncultured bacterium]